MRNRCSPIIRSWGLSCVALTAIGVIAGIAGCQRSNEPHVVVYAALDQEYSEPLLDAFAERSEIKARAVYDIESTKTVGLYNRIVYESDSPRCDLFWNNEILHTIRLANAGLLAPYSPPAANDLPEDYRSRRGLWVGFAARARVLMVNTELVPESERPTSIEDLTDPRWKDKAGLARPLFGTTATHAAVLFATWGDDRARTFFEQVRANAVFLSGNKQVAEAVSRRELAWGLTDTDDAMVELERGAPVVIVFPDQRPEQIGTLFIPNTLAILKDCPHPHEAQELVDYLLSPAVERRLAEGPSAQFPLLPAERSSTRVPGGGNVRRMDVDFEEAANHWDSAAAFLDQLLGQSRN